MDSDYILILILSAIGLVLWLFRKDHGTVLSHSEAWTMPYEQTDGRVKDDCWVDDNNRHNCRFGSINCSCRHWLVCGGTCRYRIELPR